MRRSGMWFTAIALAIAGVVIGLLAYNAGYSHGLAHSGPTVQVVRETGFPFFLFPLSLFLLFVVLRNRLLEPVAPRPVDARTERARSHRGSVRRLAPRAPRRGSGCEPR